MDECRDDHTKWNKLKGTNTIYITYMWNLKYDTNELIYKTETDSQTWNTNLKLLKGKEDGTGIN